MKRTLYTLLLCSCLSISYYSFTNGAGAPAGNTGAPGDATCVSCHGGSPITSGTNWNNFTITTNVPASGYTPGGIYTITVTHAVSGINKWGFEAVALNSSNAQAGSITAGTGNQVISSGGKTYVTHTGSGNTGTGGRSWSFTWTAPNPGVGNVTIYAAVNAADGNGSANSGDQIYTKSAVVSEFSNNPTAVIDGIPANGYACLGDTLYLAGSGINSPTDFSWTFSGLSASTLQNPAVVFTSTGTKTITLVTTNTFGSSATNTKTVNVVNKPNATLVPAGSTLTKCGSDSVTISTTASSAFSFLWTPGGQTTSSIKVRDTGDYAAKVSNPLTGCFVQTAPIKVVQFPAPVPVFTISDDSICSKDSLTLTSSQPFANYHFLNGTTTLQNGASATYKGVLAPGLHQLGLIVTGTNSCKSDTIKKQVWVQGPLPAPVLSCGTKTTSTVSFNWTAVADAVAYEVSSDTGNTWTLLAAGTLSYTFNGLSPNVNKQLWVRAKAAGLCTDGITATLICTNGACSPIAYQVAFDPSHCLASNQDSVLVPITFSGITLSQYSISIDNRAPEINLVHEYYVKVGANAVRLMIVDSSNLGCPQVDTMLVLQGVNPIATKPVVSVLGSLCEGDSANHVLQIAPANTGGNYFELYQHNQSSPLATFTNAAGNAILTYSVAANLSSIHTGDKLYAIAKDTILGCSKSSDTLVANVLAEPVLGFSYIRNGFELTFTDTSTASATNRNWYFSGAALDQIDAPATITRTFTAGGSYPVLLVASNTNGCRGYVAQDVVVFNTGLQDVNDGKPQIHLYPNPSSSEIQISIVSDEATNLTIEVFDLKGARIVTLFNNEVDAHTPQVVSFDGTQVGEGVYFCRITTDQNVNIEKIIITR